MPPTIAKPTAKPAAAPPKPGPKAPPKPAAAAPKAAPPKPAPARPAPPKPAAPAATKPAPAKPAAAPPKPGPKPAAPAATKPATPPAPSAGALEKRVKDLEDTIESLSGLVLSFRRPIAQFQLMLAGFEQFADADDDGNIVLDVENANRETLRDWSYNFGVGDMNAETEVIRAALLKARSAKDFAGWVVVNEGKAPPEGEEAAPAEGEASAEGEEITEEQINKMNWADLTRLAGEIGIDFSDIAKPKPQPKVLRNRIMEALAASGGEEGTEEAAAAEEGTLNVGDRLIVTVEGQEHGALFQEMDEDGNYVVKWEVEGDAGEPVAVPAESVSMPAE